LVPNQKSEQHPYSDLKKRITIKENENERKQDTDFEKMPINILQFLIKIDSAAGGKNATRNV